MIRTSKILTVYSNSNWSAQFMRSFTPSMNDKYFRTIINDMLPIFLSLIASSCLMLTLSWLMIRCMQSWSAIQSSPYSCARCKMPCGDENHLELLDGSHLSLRFDHFFLEAKLYRCPSRFAISGNDHHHRAWAIVVALLGHGAGLPKAALLPHVLWEKVRNLYLINPNLDLFLVVLKEV